MPRKPATDFLKGAASLPEAAWNLWDEIVSPESTQKFASYLQDPARWVHVEEGSDLWSRQRQIIEAVRDHRRVAVPSCYQSGKSYIAARIVAQWVSCHPAGEAFAVTTATTDAQVRAVLWRELRRAHKSAHLLGRLTEREWKINDELVAMGRKPADYNPEAFQGLHARYILVVIDEAAGVPEVIFRAAAGLASNENSRILAIGNPNDPQSYFASVCQPDSGWEVIPISAFDTPNFTGEVVPSVVGDSLISKNYVQELREEVGEDSPVYITKVLGKFPENREDGVIPLSWVRACQNLDEHYTADQLLPVELGMDVGAGGDETNIRVRYGLKAGRAWKRKTPDWQDAVALALEAIEETHAIAIKIDRIGVGWGVEGRLKELYDEGKHLARVIGVNVGQSPANKEKYPRLRDQLWWEVGRELSRGFAWDLSVLKDKEVAQLISPTYFRDTANRIHIEAKVETRKRLKRSPDDADALLLAFYEPTQSAGVWFLDSAWGEGVSAVGEEMGIGLGGLG